MFNQVPDFTSNAQVANVPPYTALFDGSKLSSIGPAIADVAFTQRTPAEMRHTVSTIDHIEYQTYGAPPLAPTGFREHCCEVPFANLDMAERAVRWRQFVDTENLAAMAVAVTCGITAEIANATNYVDETALMQAASSGDAGLVSALLRVAGICPNRVDLCGETALSRAAMAGYAHVVKILLKHPGIEQNLGAPLKLAAQRGDAVMFNALLDGPPIAAATLIAMARAQRRT